MKNLIFTMKLFLFQAIAIGMLCSCSQNESKLEQPSGKSHDVIIYSIENKSNENTAIYQTNPLNDVTFNYNEKHIIKGSSTFGEKTSLKNKEIVYFNDKNTDNRVIAFYIDKTYGIQKSAIFEYKTTKNILYVTTYDLNNNKLFDIEVDIIAQTGVLTNIHGEDAVQTRLNGCNLAIYAAGIPWTLGFGMLNPFAGVAAGTFFWVLEDAIC